METWIKGFVNSLPWIVFGIFATIIGFVVNLPVLWNLLIGRRDSPPQISFDKPLDDAKIAQIIATATAGAFTVGAVLDAFQQPDIACSVGQNALDMIDEMQSPNYASMLADSSFDSSDSVVQGIDAVLGLPELF